MLPTLALNSWAQAILLSPLIEQTIFNTQLNLQINKANAK